jgi:hypothetical protein
VVADSIQQVLAIRGVDQAGLQRAGHRHGLRRDVLHLHVLALEEGHNAHHDCDGGGQSPQKQGIPDQGTSLPGQVVDQVMLVGLDQEECHQGQQQGGHADGLEDLALGAPDQSWQVGLLDREAQQRHRQEQQERRPAMPGAP